MGGLLGCRDEARANESQRAQPNLGLEHCRAPLVSSIILLLSKVRRVTSNLRSLAVRAGTAVVLFKPFVHRAGRAQLSLQGSGMKTCFNACKCSENPNGLVPIYM